MDGKKEGRKKERKEMGRSRHYLNVILVSSIVLVHGLEPANVVVAMRHQVDI